MIWAAERPIVLLGGSRWSEAACASSQRFAERFALPVATRSAARICSTRCTLHMRATSASGSIRSSRAREGGRPHPPGGRPARRDAEPGLHAARHPGAEAEIRPHLSRRRRARPCLPADLAINAAPTAFAAALEGLQPPNDIRWRVWRRARTPTIWPGPTSRPTCRAPVNMGEIMVWLRASLPPDAVITNGAGNFSIWMHRFSRYRTYGTSLRRSRARWAMACRPRSAMKRLEPERTVVCFAGDGDFLMNGQEFATAVQYDLPIIVDGDGQRHVRHHPHAPGARISRPRGRHRAAEPGLRRLCARLRRLRRDGGEDRGFPPAFEAAQKSGKPAIIHVKVDPEAITPAMSLSAIREKALAERN